MKKDKIDNLTSLMKAEKMDAFLVGPSEELMYLTGFSPRPCERFQGLFIKNDGSYFYVCNRIYTGEIAAVIKDMKLIDWFDGEFMPEALYKIMKMKIFSTRLSGSTQPFRHSAFWISLPKQTLNL